MHYSQQDNAFMQQALAKAHEALYLTSPNPRVGCVLVNPQGEVIGSGHTQAAGQAHAETMALQAATLRHKSTLGATAYVTLEPCSHHGRTGPCCDALLAAGVSRVVVAQVDPNPLVSGQGIARLRAAGVLVDVGLLDQPAEALNVGFFKRMRTGLPWVRLKVAISLDGQTALANGVSQWITSTPARTDGHHWRARACAVLTGVGTVKLDDPSLDVRLVDTPRQPPLVVVDSQWETPANARLWQPKRPVWIYGARAQSTKREHLQSLGADTRVLPTAVGKVDLPALLSDLASRHINELHVEAGHKLNGSWLREGLVDELLIYLAPRLLGPGQPMADLPLWNDLTQSLRLEWLDIQSIGSDLRLRASVLSAD